MEWAQQKKHNETKNVTNKTKVDIYNDNSVKPGCKEDKIDIKAANETDEGPPKVSGNLPP
jgi:hypothetical protein